MRFRFEEILQERGTGEAGSKFEWWGGRNIEYDGGRSRYYEEVV
jgi:hypothetical protein